MPSIADTVTQVAAAGVPVVFLDTCCILDVVRAPLPDRKLVGCTEAATELIAMATGKPPACSLVVGSFVPAEWTKNAPVVLAELERRFNRMDEEADLFHKLCGHFTLTIGFGRPQYAGSALANRLRDLSQQLLMSATVLDSHPDAVTRAYQRVAVSQRRPCRKGGELKDCTIFEECLEVCRQLQAGGFKRKMIFCTSNTDDYCEPGVVPHAHIATDCAAVGLRFTTNLPWAVSDAKT